MREIIKKQLKELNIKFNDNDLNIIIPKSTLTSASKNIIINNSIKQLLLNHKYEIEIAKYIINEPANFTLSTNWNNNTKPTDQHLYIQVIKVMGKMIKVNSVGINDNSKWSGWLPLGACTIIREV